MQTWEAITSRRNVRSFSDRQVSTEQLDQILDTNLKGTVFAVQACLPALDSRPSALSTWAR